MRDLEVVALQPAVDSDNQPDIDSELILRACIEQLTEGIFQIMYTMNALEEEA